MIFFPLALFFLFFTHLRKLAEKMISFYLLWTGCYVVLLSRLSEKWLKFKPKATISKEFPSVTLLIPFRNELGNLPDLVKEFSKIDYSELRIILVDDHSEDGSFDFLLEKFHSDHRVRILQSPGVGKKEAIEFGLDAADSELILCSDADCSFSKVWVKEMVTPFSDPKVQFVAGPVISIGRTHFFQRFQQIEWSSILLLTQYFFSVKSGHSCAAEPIFAIESRPLKRCKATTKTDNTSQG